MEWILLSAMVIRTLRTHHALLRPPRSLWPGFPQISRIFLLFLLLRVFHPAKQFGVGEGKKNGYKRTQ